MNEIMKNVIRCRHCHLNQFMTQSGQCRKCRHDLVAKPEPVRDDHRPKVAAKPLPSVAVRFDIAFTVRLLRQAHGLSQRQLAVRMGCPRSYISKLENHKAAPTIASIETLAAAMDTTPYAMITIAEAACAA